jgi:hypothetical protein
MPAAAAKHEMTSTPRNTPRRSAACVTKGMAKMRTIMGAASTTPIVPASSPLAASQTGKNGV